MNNILPFIVVLGIIIFVHEFGHFITAKAFGMRVFIFSFGFGKRLLGFKWGDTDYRLSLVPLGGYVKLEGEPDDVLDALLAEGFEEYKREISRSRRDRRPRGGFWQGLNCRTGAVASAIWIRPPERPGALLFIDVDGEPVQGRVHEPGAA